MPVLRPVSGIRSLPVLRSLLRLRDELQTHRRLRRSDLGGIRTFETPVQTNGRYVVRGETRDGRDVFVKARRSQEAIAHEVSTLRVAAAAGAPVAQLLAHLPGMPAILVTEAVEGRPLGPDSPRDDWVAAGRALERLHATPTEGLPGAGTSVDDWYRRWAEDTWDELDRAVDAGLVDAQTIRPALDRAIGVVVGSPVPALTLVHGDCMPKHVVIDEDGHGRFIDLDAAGVGDPRWDVAVLTTFAPEQLAPVLEGLGSSDTSLPAVVHAYRVVRLLRALNWHATHGVDLDDIRPRLDAAVGAGPVEPTSQSDAAPAT